MPCYNVNSTLYLVVFFAFALFESLLCSGIIYGWASIVVVFKMEYFFMDLCKDWNEKHNKTLVTHDSFLSSNYTVVGSAVIITDNKIPGCPAQDARLNLIFTLSLFFLCGIKFPAGVFIDKCGPRTARIAGGIMYLIASFGLGLVVIGYENLLFGIFPLLAMGGSLLVVSVYQVSNILYREYRSRVMCILHGSFDSSSVIMLIFKLLYDAGVPFKNIMMVYGSIAALSIIGGTVILIPPLKVLFEWVYEEKRMRGYYVTSKEDDADVAVEKSIDANGDAPNYGTINTVRMSDLDEKKEDLSLTDSEELLLKDAELNDEQPLVEVKNSPKEESVLTSVFSLLYFFELLFLVTFQLKLWYYVGTLAMFLGKLTDYDTAELSKYVDIFGYVQFCGIFVTPIVGVIFDKDRIGKADEMLIVSEDEAKLQSLRKCIAPFAVTNILCILFCIVSSIEHLKLQILSFFLYTVVRGFLYSNHGAYMGAAFPPSQFGTLYGLGIFVGGAIGVLQYPLFELTATYLKNDPFWVNMMLLGFVLIGNIHPFYLWWYCRKEEKRLSAR